MMGMTKVAMGLLVVKALVLMLLAVIPGIISVRVAVRLWQVNKRLAWVPLSAFICHLIVLCVLPVGIWTILVSTGVGFTTGWLAAYCEKKEARLRNILE